MRAVHRLRTTGNVMPDHRNSGRPRTAKIPGNEERIIQHMQENRKEGIRRMALRLNLTYSTIQRTLRSERYHAFHYQRVQNLLPRNYAARTIFCQWLSIVTNKTRISLTGRFLLTSLIS